jgi:hypothetical protein
VPELNPVNEWTWEEDSWGDGVNPGEAVGHTVIDSSELKEANDVMEFFTEGIGDEVTDI